jgi:hypothetical protein
VFCYSNHRYSRLRDSDPEHPVYKPCAALGNNAFPEHSEGFQSSKSSPNGLMVVQKLYMEYQNPSRPTDHKRSLLRNFDGRFAPHSPAYRVAELLRKVERMKRGGHRV